MPSNKKEVRKLNNHEKAILKTLLEHKHFLTTRQAAQRSGVSWTTANKYLRELQKSKWIMYKDWEGKDYWKAESE